MVFQRLATRFKRPQPPSGSTHTNPGVGTTPPAGSITTAIDSSQQATNERDLWLVAFGQLSHQSQLELEKLGMKCKDSKPLTDQIEAFQKEAERLRDQSLAKEWKIRIGGYEIPIRQTTVNIVHWATRIGDVAIQFSPSPGAGIWAVVKSILQEIDTFDKEKSALLSVVDKAAGAIFCGQVYYEIYTPERTGRKDVVHKLHETLVDLYTCILELLATSTDLSSNTAIQFCHAVFDSKKPSGTLSELQIQEQNLAAAAARCESTAHARQEAELRRFLQEADETRNKISYNVEQVLQWVSEQERRSLLEWISTVQYGHHHDEIEERRHPSTGIWLVEHKRFREWMDSPSSSILWLQGSPGTGKTFLTSSVVRHIESTIGSQIEGFAYFFCNRADLDRREALPVLRSLVRQLASPRHSPQSIRKSLREAQVKATDRASQLRLSECLDQLLGSFNLYSTTFIILDALDEVLDDELNLLMEKLDVIFRKTKTGNRVKLFVASRPEKEIARMYGSGPSIIIHASDNKADIEQFVKMELDAIEKNFPNSHVNVMKDMIITTILDKCDNMFLWAALQVKQVTRCDSADAVESALETLPRGLKATYDQILVKIRSRLLPERELAEHTIKWVMCAPSPLSSEELLAAVRMSVEGDQIELTAPVNQEALLSICENLLMVDSDGLWRFFHLSAREYFETTRELSQDAPSYCAQVCFQSLMTTFGPTRSSVSTRSDMSQGLGMIQDLFDPTHPFCQHVQTKWPFYAVQLTENDESVNYLKQFLGSMKRSSTFLIRWASQVFHSHRYPDFPSSFLLSEKDLSPIMTPVFTIAWFSLHKVLRDWFDIQTFDPSQTNESDDSLLMIASMTGCVSLCADLILRGASVDQRTTTYRSDTGNALTAAAYSGELQTVRYLAEEAHADVNLQLQAGKYGSALAAAACEGKQEIVRYLIEEAQADVNLQLQAGRYGSALAAAAKEGKLEIVRYLVEDAHADVNLLLEAGDCGSALATAVKAGMLETVRYLVEDAHADVNLQLQAGKYGSALAVAASWGRLSTAQYLAEEAHADVNLQLQQGRYGSALAAAACEGKLEIARYLAEEAHADVNLQLQAGKYGSALAAAVEEGKLKLVRYLVEDAHADVNLQLQAGRYGSALAAAAKEGRLEIVRYLVEDAHADVNLLLEAGDCGSALAAAARARKLEIVRYLVEEAEADVNLLLQAGEYGSALTAAAWGGDQNVVQYLVEEGNAEVNLQLETGPFSSALHMARYLEDPSTFYDDGNNDGLISRVVGWIDGFASGIL